jgi:hypothetical protein
LSMNHSIREKVIMIILRRSAEMVLLRGIGPPTPSLPMFESVVY